MNIVEKVIDYFGNQEETIKGLNISRQLLDIWIRQKFIPFKRGEFIEHKTDGCIKRLEVWESAAKARKH